VRFVPLIPLLLLAACSPGSKLRDRLTGTWTRGDTFEMTLAADGRFISQWKVPTKSLTYMGTWKVQGSSVVSIITNCSAQDTTNFEKVGTTEHWVIIRADQSELVWSNNEQTVSLKRKK